MFVPLWLLALLCLVAAGACAWAFLLATGRNPLPFPDRGSRIFSAASPEAKAAVVALLGHFGVKERFQFNSSGILRSILWDGTIINCPPAETRRKLDDASSSIGLVSADPAASAREAVEFLRARGFEARVVADVEPELPITFVLTNALSGTVLNFRKHVIHLPRPQSVR
jgi:hypothetical protein